MVTAIATMTTNITINAFPQTEPDPEQLRTNCLHVNQMACNALNGDRGSCTIHPSPNESPLNVCPKIACAQ
jgi:hypothetical protein